MAFPKHHRRTVGTIRSRDRKWSSWYPKQLRMLAAWVEDVVIRLTLLSVSLFSQISCSGRCLVMTFLVFPTIVGGFSVGDLREHHLGGIPLPSLLYAVHPYSIQVKT